MYIVNGIKKLGAAAGLVASLFAVGCGEKPAPVHKLSNDWTTTVYSKDVSILDARQTPAYVFEECPQAGGPCTQYIFPGSQKDVDRAVTRMKKGETYTFTVGNLDSIRPADEGR